MRGVGTAEPLAEAIDAGLADLAGFVDPALPGWSREVFSQPYLVSRDYVRRLMADVGLDVRTDEIGNTIGHLPGRAADRGHRLAPLVCGSHTDTVVGGGRFDGIVGVVGAVEAVRALREAGQRLERDLYVVDFLGEEANRFGNSCIGSRAMAGALPVEHLDLRDPEGRTLGSAMQSAGIDPARALEARWEPGSVHAYVELHIEQGPLLERTSRQIGVVTGITGIERLLATFTGRTDHAGTTPMDARHDALAAAAAAVLAIENEACSAPTHAVATTGRIESAPGVVNAVPGAARLWAEMRSTDPLWIPRAKARLIERIGQEADARGVSTLLEWVSDGMPVSTTDTVRDRIATGADRLGLTWEAVPSGAGHDAAFMAALGPMGMIFVPSVDGRSHCPEEFTPTSMIVDGVRVLLETLRDLDAGSPVS